MPLANEMFTNESSRDYLKKGYFKAYDILADYLEGKYNSRYPKESYEDVYTQLKNERKDDIAKELENLVFENLV